MKNGNVRLVLLSLATGLLALTGCSRERSTANAPPVSATVDGAKYLLDSEPEGGIGVINIRKEAKDQDEVVIVGRIGGSVVPWVEDRAAFFIVDLSLKSCADIGSDNCPNPWDFC
jgi:predicted acetyltransferase